MFSIKPNASKIALVYLAKRLKDLDFHFIDCQVPTEHLTSMGAEEISRIEFLKYLDKALGFDSKIGSWSDLNAD